MSAAKMMMVGRVANWPGLVPRRRSNTNSAARTVVSATGTPRAAKKRLGDANTAGATAKAIPQASTAIAPAAATTLDCRGAESAIKTKIAANRLARADMFGTFGEPRNPPRRLTAKSPRSTALRGSTIQRAVKRAPRTSYQSRVCDSADELHRGGRGYNRLMPALAGRV